MTTIITIDQDDQISSSRSDINTNFANLNSDKIETSVIDTDTTLSANSDSKIPSQKAVKAYVDSGGNQNASESQAGIVEEATDAEITAGTSTGGSGAKLFVTPAKLKSSGILKFGGDGSDGALTITSGTTTIDLGNAAVVTKNYTSISITGTGKLAFSNPNTSGTIIILKSQGDVTLTSSTNPNIDASGMGAAGGNAASNGTNPTTLFTGETMRGVAGISDNGGGGSNTAGTQILHPNFYLTSNNFLFRKNINLVCGAGGGGGGNSNGVSGGAGGRGGAAVLIECGGSLNMTGNISVAGANGSNGNNATSTNASPGGGGGGGGGMCVVLYNLLTASSGSINSAGGNGGNGGTGAGTTGNEGDGGGGGGSVWGAGGSGSTNGAAGSAGSGGAGGGGGAGIDGSGAGGTGGAGGASQGGLVIKNTEFA